MEDTLDRADVFWLLSYFLGSSPRGDLVREDLFSPEHQLKTPEAPRGPEKTDPIQVRRRRFGGVMEKVVWAMEYYF